MHNLKIVPDGSLTESSENVNSGKQNDKFTKAIDRFISHCKARDLSNTTIEDYRLWLNQFYWWCTEVENLEPDPTQITSDDITAFIGYLKTENKKRWGRDVLKGKEKLSPTTVASYCRGIRVFFNYLEKRRVISHSPFTEDITITSKKEPIESRHHKNLNEDELTVIFSYLSQPELTKRYNGARNYAIISLLLDSGMRRGELISMQIKDIEWEKSRVTIRGKTGPRTCFFSSRTRMALLNYYDNHRSLQKGQLAQNSPFWLSSDGNPLTGNGLHSCIFYINKKLNAKFSAHQLRHTFASVMVKRVGIFQLKEMLGHKSVTTTEIYTHGSPDQLQEAYKGNSPLDLMDLGLSKPKGRRGRKREIKD